MAARVDDFYTDLEFLQQQPQAPPQQSSDFFSDLEALQQQQSKDKTLPLQQAKQAAQQGLQKQPDLKAEQPKSKLVDFISDLESQPASQAQPQNQQNDFFSDLEQAASKPQKQAKSFPFLPGKKETKTEQKQGKLLEQFNRGLQESASGELAQQFFEPQTQQKLESDPSFWESLVHEAGTVTGDLPYLAAGATLGGILGVPGGPIGITVGAGFGATALPAFLKESLKQYRDFQDKGGDLTFGEFLQRADKVANRTLNEGLFGAILGMTKKAIPLLESTPIGKLFSTKIGKAAATTTAEAAVATAVPAAAEGRVPEKEDFARALALFAGFNLAHLPVNVKDYVQKQGEASGLPPEQFAKEYSPSNLEKIQRVAESNVPKAEAKAQPKAEENTFTTEKGSVYQLNEDGTTTRTKAVRSEHPGDEGLKPKSEKTWFVSPEDAKKLGEVQTSGGSKRLFEFPDGKIGVQYTEGPDTGKVESRTVLEPQTKPAVGLVPVEIWQDGKEVHFGNKITDVKAKPVELPKGAVLTKPEHIRTGFKAGKSTATISVEKEGAYFPHDIELTKQEKTLIDAANQWEKAGDHKEASDLNEQARQMIFARIKGQPSKLEVSAPKTPLAERVHKQPQGTTVPEGIQRIVSKSAEKAPTQTVKNQHGKEVAIPKTFYHGTIREVKGELKPDSRGIVHFADSKNDVLEANVNAASRAGKQGHVITKDLDLNKVFVNSEKQKREYSKANIDQLKKAGYNGVYFPEHGIFEYFTKEPIDLEHLQQVKKERMLINAETFRWKDPKDKAEFIRRVNEGSFGPGEVNEFTKGKLYARTTGPTLEEIAKEKGLPVSLLKATPLSQEKPSERMPTRGKKTLDQAVSFEAPEPKAEKSEGMGFRQAIVDELFPLQKYVQENKSSKEIPFSQDPYKMSRLYKGWQGKAEVFLEHKSFDPDTIKWTGKGLREIIKPYKKDLPGLSKYLVARRAIELESQGKETGVDISDAKRYVAENAKTYEKARKELRDYQNSLLDYAEKSGLISAETKDLWQGLNADYVPFQRVFSPEGKEYFGGKSMVPKQQFFRLEGSQRPIVDPLESIIGNTYKIIEASEKNRVIRSLVEFEKNKQGAGEFIETKEIGEEEPTLKNFSDYLQGKDVVEGNKIKYFDNGKLKTIEVDPSVAAVLKGNFGPREMTYLGKLLQYPTRWTRTGAIALNPEKLVKLALQDQFEAYVYSQVGYVPGVDLVRGIFHSVKKGDLYNQWRAAGGDQSLAMDMSRTRKQETLKKVAGVKNVVRSADDVMRIIEDVFKPLETSTRVSLFERALKRKGQSPDALREAALLARETTLDYAKKGAKTQILTESIPFFNAAVQGIDKFIQEAKRNPKGVALKGTAFLTVPTVALWLWNKTNYPREYEEIPAWEKNAFWNIFVGIPGMEKPLHVKIPKPHELGFVFASAPEHVLEYIDKKDPEAIKELGKLGFDAFTPPIIPAGVRPMIEQFANRKLLTGAPLIPQRLEKLPPEEQITPYTSESAKVVGKIIQHIPYVGDTKLASPIVVDHWISSMSGGLGRRLIDFTESKLRKTGVLPEKVEVEKELSDLPILGAFIGRTPGMQSASITKFYTEAERLEKQVNAIKKAAKEGRQSEIKDKEAIVAKHKKAQKIRKAFSNIRKAITNIVEDQENYTPAEKKILIDQLTADAVGVAREFHGKDS
jgi:hypothetical protein